MIFVAQIILILLRWFRLTAIENHIWLCWFRLTAIENHIWLCWFRLTAIENLIWFTVFGSSWSSTFEPWGNFSFFHNFCRSLSSLSFGLKWICPERGSWSKNRRGSLCKEWVLRESILCLLSFELGIAVFVIRYRFEDDFWWLLFLGVFLFIIWIWGWLCKWLIICQFNCLIWGVLILWVAFYIEERLDNDRFTCLLTCLAELFSHF